MAGGLKLYKSYSFRDKDPIIDKMRTIIKDEDATYAEIHERSGVSTNTLYQWFDGKTQRPQFATVMAVARSIGFDLQVVRQQQSGRSKIIILDTHRRRKSAAA